MFFIEAFYKTLVSKRLCKESRCLKSGLFLAYAKSRFSDDVTHMYEVYSYFRNLPVNQICGVLEYCYGKYTPLEEYPILE